jgi:hypothetical protein
MVDRKETTIPKRDNNCSHSMGIVAMSAAGVVAITACTETASRRMFTDSNVSVALKESGYSETGCDIKIKIHQSLFKIGNNNKCAIKAYG